MKEENPRQKAYRLLTVSVDFKNAQECGIRKRRVKWLMFLLY